MTQTDTATTAPQTLSRPARLAWLLLILATLYICYFHNLGAIGLVGPDEPRYAWIARAMAESGDWITPRLYGKPWFEKPVLYYWGAAAFFKVFGVSEVTARLPSALSALLATLALAWLALRLYGAETARWLLLLLPTTVGMIGFSHAAATDMPFAAMLTIAMVFAARLVGLVPIRMAEVKEVNEIKEDPEKSDRPPHRAFVVKPAASVTSFTSSTFFISVFFGFFLGLATLAKGPAAIILSGGAVLLWALVTKRWRDAFRCLHPLAIASFCLTALPWYTLCARRNPDFFRVFIIEHNFRRYLTPEFQHIQPFWFYIPILLLAVFPWTALLIPCTRTMVRVCKDHKISSENTLFFLSWSVFPFFFFTVSKSKLPGYILPAVLPLLLLMAATVPRILCEGSLRWWLALQGLSVTGLGIGIYVASVKDKLPRNTDNVLSKDVLPIIYLAVLTGLGIVAVSLLRHRSAALLATVLSVLLLVVSGDRWLETVDPELTARTAIAEAEKFWPDFHLESSAAWNLRRSLLYQLSFYSHAEIKEWTPGEPPPQWLFVHPPQAKPSGLSCQPLSVFPALEVCRTTTSSGRP